MTYSLIGKQFRHLTVIDYVGRDKDRRRSWLCKCECGKTKVYATFRLTGKQKPAETCGCCEDHINRKEAYISWMSAKSRCLQESNKDYPNYGGRRIKFDPDWLDFKNFYRDMGDPPFDPNTGERLSLDRMNNDGNYCKNNCCWSTRSEQQLNKTRQVIDPSVRMFKLDNGDLQS